MYKFHVTTLHVSVINITDQTLVSFYIYLQSEFNMEKKVRRIKYPGIKYNIKILKVY